MNLFPKKNWEMHKLVIGNQKFFQDVKQTTDANISSTFEKIITKNLNKTQIWFNPEWETSPQNIH